MMHINEKIIGNQLNVTFCNYGPYYNKQHWIYIGTYIIIESEEAAFEKNRGHYILIYFNLK